MLFKELGEEGERVNLMGACHVPAFSPDSQTPVTVPSQVCPRSQVNRGMPP